MYEIPNAWLCLLFSHIVIRCNRYEQRYFFERITEKKTYKTSQFCCVVASSATSMVVAAVAQMVYYLWFTNRIFPCDFCACVCVCECERVLV